MRVKAIMITREEKRHTLIFLVCVTTPLIVSVAPAVAFWCDHPVLGAFLFCLAAIVGVLCYRTVCRLGTVHSALTMMVVASALLVGSLMWMSPVGRQWLGLEPIMRISLALVIAACSAVTLFLLILRRNTKGPES